MTDNTILWRRGNGMFTRHTVRLPGKADGETFDKSVKRYARDVFNAFDAIAAIEIYDCDGVLFVGTAPTVTIMREEVYRCVA